MASTHKHLRSSTANKRPTTSIADGQIALNTNTASPGLFFKDSTGATIIKVGPVHVGTTAPNASPAAGGSTGNSTGEVWLDTSLTPNGVKIWNGSAWVNATPVGSTTVQGLLELATDAETQAGSDTARAVTPASLQSKMSDSATTTSATTIASSTAVKTAYDLANAALARSGGTITGNLEIGTTGSLSFEGSTADGFETTIAVTDPTADRTITLPDTTGTVVTTGDTGTVTSTMIADGTIVNADVNASAAIAGTKISPDFGAQNVTTTGTSTAASFIPTSSTVPTNGVYLPAANSVGISTNGSGRLFVDSSGRVGIGATPSASIPASAVCHVVGDLSVGVTDAGNCGIAVGSGATGDRNANIDFIGDTTYATFGLRVIRNGGANSKSRIVHRGTGDFDLATVDASSVVMYTQNTEKLRITSAGLVGIGTSSPGATLDVAGTAAQFQTNLRLGGSTHATSRRSSISFNNDWLLVTDVAGNGTRDFGFYNSALNVNTLVIDTSARVGIGTSAPTATLYVSNTSGIDPSLIYGATSGQTFRNGTTELAFGAATTAPFAHWIQARFSNNTAQPLVLNPSGGNVGIGTSAPGQKLVVSESGAQGLELNPSSATAFVIAGYNRNTSAYIDLDYQGSNHIFRNGTSERARIDSSGRLLVGTSTARDPSGEAKIESFNGPIVVSTFANSPGFYGLNFIKSRGTSTNVVVQNNDSLSAVRFFAADGTSFIEGARIEAFVDGTPGTNDMPGRIVLSTTLDGASSPTERMRITNAGKILVGQTSTYAACDGWANITYTSASTAAPTLGLVNASATAAWVSFSDSATVFGSITRSGSSTVYATSSDYRLKENVVAVNDGITRLQQLKPSRFNFIVDPTKTVDGFIAHEVQDVVPEAITGEKDAVDDEGNPIYQGIDQSKLVPLLTAALQEAIGEIESLKARVAALEA